MVLLPQAHWYAAAELERPWTPVHGTLSLAAPPSPHRGCELGIPLIDRIVIPHTDITPPANWHEVVNCCLTALGFRDIVTALVIKHIHTVRAPDNLTLGLELLADFEYPYLFA